MPTLPVSSSKGFVYYSFGRDYLDETLVSIKTLLKHNRTAKVCVITDAPGEQYINEKYPGSGIEQIKRVKVDSFEGFWAFRLRLDTLTPYEKTIFLDGDTYILGYIEDLFDLLDTFDFVAVPDESHPARGFILGLKGGYKALNYYNCGFFIFKNTEKIHKLFETWRKEYVDLAELEPGDQGPLVRALIKTDVRFITLPKEYNLRLINKCVSFQQRVKMIHGRAKDHDKLAGILNNIDFIDRSSRVWIPHLQRVIKAVQFRNFYRILRLLKMDNVQEGAHAKESQKNLAQKVLPFLGKKAGQIKDTLAEAMPKKTSGALDLQSGQENEIYCLDKALMDLLTKKCSIRSALVCADGNKDIIARAFNGRPMNIVSIDITGNNGEPYVSGQKADLVWCCGIAEQMAPSRVKSLITTLTENTSGLIVMTCGIPGYPAGDRRFRLMPEKHWSQLISDRGFYLDPYLTLELRKASGNGYFKQCGLVFEKE